MDGLYSRIRKIEKEIKERNETIIKIENEIKELKEQKEQNDQIKLNPDGAFIANITYEKQPDGTLKYKTMEIPKDQSKMMYPSLSAVSLHSKQSICYSCGYMLVYELNEKIYKCKNEKCSRFHKD